MNRIQRCPAVSTGADGARGSRLDAVENVFGHSLQLTPRLLNAFLFAVGTTIPNDGPRLCLHVLDQLLGKVYAGLKLFFREKCGIGNMTRSKGSNGKGWETVKMFQEVAEPSIAGGDCVSKLGEGEHVVEKLRGSRDFIA